MKLDNVTLIAVTGTDALATIESLRKCYSLLDFAEVKLVTDQIKICNDHNIIIEYPSHPLNSYYNYNNYTFRELGDHVQTSHCLLVQYDSWILRPELWDDGWLQYDYIGAPWPIKENSYICHDLNERVRVGNGGFSLRSKKLLDIPKQYNIPLTQEQGYFNEDGNACVYHRKQLLELGIKYAPIEVAAVFSHELDVAESVLSFGFHRYM